LYPYVAVELFTEELAMFYKQILNKGLTLPELMATLCISVILAALAIPNFMNVMRSNRSTTIANQLVSALAYTRSEAIKRGQQVTIRHKGEIGRMWEKGWDIFTDSNGDGMMNMSDELLKTYDALPEGHTLRTGGTYEYWVAYKPDGKSDGAKLGHDTFRLCDSSRDNMTSRAIIISKTGRARTKKGTITCP
jgi:type IV fimbrial biogenesis protein FimT